MKRFIQIALLISFLPLALYMCGNETEELSYQKHPVPENYHAIKDTLAKLRNLGLVTGENNCRSCHIGIEHIREPKSAMMQAILFKDQNQCARYGLDQWA